MAVLVTTAARNSSVRLLQCDDIDLVRGVIRFRRAKGDEESEDDAGHGRMNSGRQHGDP